MSNFTKRLGAMGWPLVAVEGPEGRELVLGCPKCGGHDILMTVAYGPSRRLGGPYGCNINRCLTCKYQELEKHS